MAKQKKNNRGQIFDPTTEKYLTGRRSVMTKDAIAKLEQAFAYGCSDREACCYADISVDALYDYQKINPDFTKRKELLKERPVLKARKSIVEHLEEDPKLALEFLRKKKKDEFGDNIDITTKGDKVKHITYEVVFVNSKK